MYVFIYPILLLLIPVFPTSLHITISIVIMICNRLGGAVEVKIIGITIGFRPLKVGIYIYHIVTELLIRVVVTPSMPSCIVKHGN